MSRQRISTIITLLCLMTTLQAQKLVTKTPLYDCGQVLFRNPVTTEFVIKNKSSRHLEISEIKTSCGCTIASTDHNTIAGGKEATIKVVFDALIPEGWLLDVALRNTDISVLDRMSLLLLCCKECIGSVSVQEVNGTL